MAGKKEDSNSRAGHPARREIGVACQTIGDSFREEHFCPSGWCRRRFDIMLVARCFPAGGTIKRIADTFFSPWLSSF